MPVFLLLKQPKINLNQPSLILMGIGALVSSFCPFVVGIKKSAGADYLLNSSLTAATIPARALRINITVITVARILLSFPIISPSKTKADSFAFHWFYCNWFLVFHTPKQLSFSTGTRIWWVLFWVCPRGCGPRQFFLPKGFKASRPSPDQKPVKVLLWKKNNAAKPKSGPP